MLWRELFINTCILVTIFFVTSQVFKDSGISPIAPVKIRVLLGIIGGISASILVYFSIHITDKIVLDFRHILEVFVAMFGGMVSVCITGFITAVYRLIYNGISYESIVVSISVLIISAGCGVISIYKLSNKIKLVLMFAYTIIVRSTFYYIFLGHKLALIVILIFSISTIIVGLGVCYLVEYLIVAHRLLIRLKQESTQDFLTGLNNTRQFDLKYNQVLSQAIENNEKVALLMIDIDHFKNVNDNHGHIAGDEVLKELGQLLLKSCRDYDFVSRIGGEEFTVVLGNLSKTDTLEIAEGIRKSVESNIFKLSSGVMLKITVSIGVSIYPDTVTDILALKEEADTKLYEAKRTGRNKVCI